MASLIVNIIAVIIILSLIFVSAESGSDDDDGELPMGETIVWPEGEDYHAEYDNEIILAPSGGEDVPFTYNDHDFPVVEFATSGVITVGNFRTTGTEDVDIGLFGATKDENGDRRIIASSESGADTERIELDGTPDPGWNDDFDRVGTGPGSSGSTISYQARSS